MKFRYKVLIVNIILLSLGIGTVGFFMIDKNFQLALNSQIKNAIEENNIVQSAIEYELLDLSNLSADELAAPLINIGNDVTNSMSANQSTIFIIYDGKLVFTNSDNSEFYLDELWEQAEIGNKNYIIVTEEDQTYIYTSSCNVVSDKNLNIINKREITSAYKLMEDQEAYFNFLLIFVVFICSMCMSIISYLLTRPLETLNRISANFGDGDYSVRANIKTHDEIGVLANTYNTMAESVSHHVDELQDMIVRQEQFVADFTHEIKTPMTTIIGYADTLRSKEMKREKQIMAASYIFSEGRRLENMSMKLFDFIYTKQHRINAVPFMTGKLISEVAISVTPILETKNINFVTSEDNCTINGDMDLLKSAFINIIDNAKKASNDHSKIIFSGEITDDGYVFTVKDFGTGISEEHLSKICDEFYMVDKSRSRSEGGAGLGLSLAALVFKCHDAEFEIKSTLGEGTTMIVTFKEFEKVEEKENCDNEDITE